MSSRSMRTARGAAWIGFVKDLRDAGGRLAPGIQLGIGSAALVAAWFVAAARGPSVSWQMVLLMAFAVAVGAALISDLRFATAFAVMGYLLFVGFLVNQYGELRWDGRASLGPLAVFGFAFWLGLGRRWMRRGGGASSP